MNKKYISPALRTALICGQHHLLVDSLRVDKTNKVSNTDDIGFVKEQSSRSYDVWDDDWSK